MAQRTSKSLPNQRSWPHAGEKTLKTCTRETDAAGVPRLQYPLNARLIRSMCSTRVAESFIWHGFRRGAPVVWVSGCHTGDCHYINANHWLEKRIPNRSCHRSVIGLASPAASIAVSRRVTRRKSIGHFKRRINPKPPSKASPQMPLLSEWDLASSKCAKLRR